MNFTRPLPRYRCHKVVSALKVTRIIPNPRGLELHPEDERFVPIQVDDNWASKHKPSSPGYLVAYEDGYVSWSPASTFEAGYVALEGDDYQTVTITLSRGECGALFEALMALHNPETTEPA